MTGENNLSVESVRSFLEGILVPTLMCGCETQVYIDKYMSKIRAIEMENFPSIDGIRRIARI